ncbi:spore coat protein GerQ [Desulfuribacillus alkaliarsenatis]|uniref:Spore coat protein GerQ n=1 Tax=Desulfuribacillus alkaliarsenatis TaxID=766136 RepID=A0A1E5G170_9FIRM|nr:spore coat protein GerQ [Desulfuribacillus alkaliarsenatis]
MAPQRRSGTMPPGMPGMQPGMPGWPMPGMPAPGFPPVGGMLPQPPAPGQLPLEMSYIENILRLNRGKLARVYMTFEGRRENNTKVFEGIIEAAGRDHIILSDPETGQRYLLLMVYLDYVEFDEEIDYDYPFNDIPAVPFARS